MPPNRKSRLQRYTRQAIQLRIKRRNETEENRKKRLLCNRMMYYFKKHQFKESKPQYTKPLAQTREERYLERSKQQQSQTIRIYKLQNGLKPPCAFNYSFGCSVQEESCRSSQRLSSNREASGQNCSNPNIYNVVDTSSMNMDIPLEIKQEQKTQEDEMQYEIKLEPQVSEETPLDEYNPFQNVQLEVKEEVSLKEQEITDSKNYDFNEKPLEITPDDQYTRDPKTEIINDEKSEIKEECIIGDSLVTYDYPDFGDNVNDEVDDDFLDSTLDSNEAAALTRVEARLEDIKNESLFGADDNKDYKKIDIKEESDITVTETHLISNKLINTTSTVTNTYGGLIESQTTKTLVMEILPMTYTNMPLSKLNINSNPEEILPTPYQNNDDCMSFEDTFQLNSITGNVLSLEQEAYSLLKAKNKKKDLGDKLFMCPKCPKTYTQRKGLTSHLKVHESIEKRALGIIKGQKTRKKNLKMKLKAETSSVQREEKIKREGYECTCGQIFRRRSRMETCLRSHNVYSDTDSYPCVSCSKHFRNKEELSLHRKRLHTKRFPCKFCPTDYLTRKELFKHLQVHQKVQLMEYKAISEVVKGKQKLKCFICSKSFKEIPDLKSHVMDDHKEPYNCPRCNETFSKIIDFGHHTKTSHPEVEGQSVLDVLEAFSKLVKAWKCEECGLQFHEADKLAKHKIEKHSPDLKVESQFQCDDCRRVFVSQKGLTSHRRVHHSTETIEVTEPVEEGVMCLECRKICKDMNALASHTRFHSPERKYPCKFCDFRFATAEKRKAHAEIHTGDMKYVCFICEYQCSSENRLKQHKMSLKHLNMKEFLLTGKPLVDEYQSTSKEEKVRDTTKDKELVVKRKKKELSSSSPCSVVACDICGDKFQNESEMLEHKQTHPFIEFPNEDTPSRIFFK